MNENIFLHISILFGITISIAVIIRLLRQPFVVAYIIAGIVAGPLFLDLIHGNQNLFQSFAQLGVVLLLFVIGLNLDFTHIKRIGKVSTIIGVTQLLCTAGIGILILRAFHLSWTSAIALAIASTFSSTIIVLKLLADKRVTETVYGRYTVGLLLVQDFIAIILMIFLTGKHQPSLANSPLLLVAKGIILISLVYFLSKAVLPVILKKIAESSEFLFIFTIAWCFGIASLVYWTGFSLEIGAVIAGISLGSTPYHLEIMSRIRPLRDFFIVLFFIILGSGMSVSSFSQVLFPSIALSLFVLIFNPIILYLLYRAQGFTRRNSFLGGITATQVSEFGFIMLFSAHELGYTGNTELTIFTTVALVTIFLSSYIITYGEKLFHFVSPVLNFFGKDRAVQHEAKKSAFDVWVVGYHRIGWKVCETLGNKQTSFAVIDYNPEAIAKLKHRSIPCFFGDISDTDFLEEISIEKARLIIMTVPEPEPQLALIKYIRSRNKHVIIIANLSHNLYLKDLYDAGADYVMMPHLLGGQWISDILQKKTWSKTSFKKLHTRQTNDMRLRLKAEA